MKITGTVIHGDGYGRKLGYPTANISLDKPLSGVFAGTATFKDKTYPAAIFASTRRPILEVHLLDFDGDLYGKILQVEINKKLREEKKFDEEAPLRAAIEGDIDAVRAHFRTQERM